MRNSREFFENFAREPLNEKGPWLCMIIPMQPIGTLNIKLTIKRWKQNSSISCSRLKQLKIKCFRPIIPQILMKCLTNYTTNECGCMQFYTPSNWNWEYCWSFLRTEMNYYSLSAKNDSAKDCWLPGFNCYLQTNNKFISIGGTLSMPVLLNNANRLILWHHFFSQISIVLISTIKNSRQISKVSNII